MLLLSAGNHFTCSQASNSAILLKLSGEPRHLTLILRVVIGEVEKSNCFHTSLFPLAAPPGMGIQRPPEPPPGNGTPENSAQNSTSKSVRPYLVNSIVGFGSA